VYETRAFAIRDRGYDVGEVNSYLYQLEAQIAALESELAARDVVPPGDAAALLTEARLEAFRLLQTASEDAEAMVGEARREAAAIRVAADTVAQPAIPLVITLEPHLELIKSDLPVHLQRAFVAVASRRTG
jgi:cell division septum initiation protein DivIVA